jgi:formylglycine-generating enzyme required for sulfatase activity
MNNTITLTFLSLAICCASTACADTFGSGPNSFVIDFVTIGNPGNAPETVSVPNGRPHGAVDYTFRMAKYETSTDALNKANALSGLDIFHQGHEDVPPQFRYEPSKPAYFLSWYGAATFVNWLNTSTGNMPAYKFDNGGNFQLWEPSDPGYDPQNLFRNSLTNYVLPDVDEWFKAAYYDGENDIYNDYPTGSSTPPDGIDFEDDPIFDAVFNDGFEGTRPRDFMDVGIPSSYGTMGQGGNVWEWEETAKDYVNSSPTEGRAVNGGDWDNASSTQNPNSLWYLGKWHRNGPADPLTRTGIGLRVASLAVPEPTTHGLVLAVACLAICSRNPLT